MAELNVGNLEMTITADGSAAIVEMDRVTGAAGKMAGDVAGSADGISGASGKAAKSVKELGDEMANVGKKATTFITLPIMGTLTACVKGASDLTETLSKAEVVFDSHADSVLAWSESSVQAMGLAQGSALEYASTFGDMANGMGLGRQAAASMAMELTQLAADLASFKNISTEVAAQKLNAVFTGETESLKSLGIVMTQTNLQAFALSQGITKQVSAMSQAEQVALRYKYVMSVTADAQGDFARTGDSLANQTRKLSETVKQASESFGSLLLPVVTPVVEAIQGWVQKIAELDAETKNIIISTALVVAAIGPLLLVGGKLLTFITSVKVALAALSVNPIVLAIAAAVAAGAAIAGLTSKLNQATGAAGETSDAYKRMKAAIEGGVDTKVTVDDEELNKLDGIETEKTITISANGEKALADAEKLVQDLRDPRYDGMIAIDGDPQNAEEVLDQIAEDIRAVQENVTIGGQEEGLTGNEGLIEKIKADIAALDRAVIITDDPTTRADLEAKIDALKRQLGELVANVEFGFPEDDQQKLEHYRATLATLPKSQTFTGFGKFTYAESEQGHIQEFNEAMMEAAGKVGDFQAAVDKMNQAVDAELQEATLQVLQQANEQIDVLTAVYEAGNISHEQYLAGVQKEIDAKDAEIERLRAEAEAQKEFNKTFSNGDAGDDAGGVVETKIGQYEKGQIAPVSEEVTGSALQAIDAAEDRSAMLYEGATALTGLMDQVQAQYEGLTAAQEAYSTAMAEAAAQDQTAERMQADADALGAAGDAVQFYADSVALGADKQIAFDQALESLGENADPKAIQALSDALVDESGNLISWNEALRAAEEAEKDHSAAAEAAAEAQAQAAEKRKQAAEEAAASLKELSESTLSSEDMEQALIQIDETGVDISGAKTALLTGMPALVEEAYTAAETAAQSGTDPGKAIAAAVETSAGLVEDATVDAVDAAVSAGQAEGQQGASVGAAMGSSVARGLQGKISEVAAQARSMVQQAMQAAREEAQGAGATGPTGNGVTGNGIGATIAQNIAAGFETETPNAVRIIRQSTANLMSGAAGVSERRFGGTATSNGGTFRFDYEEMGARVAAAVSNLSFGFSVGGRQLAMATAEDNGQQLAIQNRRTTSRYGG